MTTTSASQLQDWYKPQLAWGGAYLEGEFAFQDDNYWAQEKLDGCRYILHFATDHDIKVYSRRTSEVTGLPVLKTDRVPHLVEELRDNFPAGTILDGEMIITDANVPRDGRSAYVTSIIGSGAEEAVRKQNEQYWLHFAVFDVIAYQGTSMVDLPLGQRYNFLQAQLPELGSGQSFIELLPFITGSEAIKKQFLEEIWARGDEGVILKNYLQPYMQDKRHRSWVKIKQELDFDCIITGFEQGRAETKKTINKQKTAEKSAAKYANMVGKVVFGQYNSAGELVDIGKASGFTDEIRKAMTESPEAFLGKVIRVKAHQQLVSGKLRHPRTDGIVRTDKNPQDCVILGPSGG